MKRYNITVNGTAYDVSVEDITGSSAPVQAAPKAAPAPAAAPAAPKVQGSAGSVKITAPMPGNILDIKIKTGDKVTRGQVVAVLEAMKMENDITAPQDGTVASVNVSKGDTVETNDTIATLS